MDSSNSHNRRNRTSIPFPTHCSYRSLCCLHPQWPGLPIMLVHLQHWNSLYSTVCMKGTMMQALHTYNFSWRWAMDKSKTTLFVWRGGNLYIPVLCVPYVLHYALQIWPLRGASRFFLSQSFFPCWATLWQVVESSFSWNPHDNLMLLLSFFLSLVAAGVGGLRILHHSCERESWELFSPCNSPCTAQLTGEQLRVVKRGLNSRKKVDIYCGKAPSFLLAAWLIVGGYVMVL